MFLIYLKILINANIKISTHESRVFSSESLKLITTHFPSILVKIVSQKILARSYFKQMMAWCKNLIRIKLSTKCKRSLKNLL